MRKLQALRLLATPGVRTSTDVVLAIVNDLERAMVQAPSDAAQAAGRAPSTGTPRWPELEQAEHPSRATRGLAASEATEADPEADRFRELHLRLHQAAIAVFEAGDGEIRLLE